jgi:hypothetical protein
LQNWLKYDLWPPSEEDFAAAEKIGLKASKVLIDKEVREKLKTRLSLAARVDIIKQPQTTTHAGVRLPIKLGKQLASLGGSKTSHIIKALELYLEQEAEQEEISTGKEI